MPYKFQIDPHKESGRDTICQTLRYIHRRFMAAGDVEGAELAARAFSYAKQMNQRLVYYRDTYEPHRVGPQIPDGGA